MTLGAGETGCGDGAIRLEMKKSSRAEQWESRAARQSCLESGLRDWNPLRNASKGGTSKCSTNEEARNMTLGAGETGCGDGAGVGGRITGM
jgi:hypothetical protein